MAVDVVGFEALVFCLQGPLHTHPQVAMRLWHGLSRADALKGLLHGKIVDEDVGCLLYTSPSPRD
eukprot:4546222-Alexandrium_andersonii.AAC.1